MKSSMNKVIKKNKFKFLVLFVFLLITVSFGSYYFYENYVENDLSPEVKEIIKKNKSKKKVTKEEDDEQQTYENHLPQYRNEYNNSYIAGKLVIPELKINSLITRASNNNYYIDHNIYNAYDVLGNPFFDYRNMNLSTDRQINIYGHNTENEKYYDALPFTNLEAYTDVNVFSNVKNIVLEIDEKKLQFQVIAVKIITEDDNEHMKLIFYSDEDYLNHVNKLLNNTLYKDDEKIASTDRLLVLQACHYNPIGSYILIIAKEII